MNSERLKQIEEVYHLALEAPPGERESFIRQYCGPDNGLRLEVKSLLSFENSRDEFIDMPPASLAAELFSERERPPRLIEKNVGHYKIKSFLGKGGMGEVYLAQDTRLDRRVALKILPVNFVRDAERMRRFVREAKTASALNHPNIITIHEIGNVDDTHFIASEFIEGETLFTLIKTHQLNLNSALDIAVQIASSLGAAHAAGIIHRDIKPENIMVRPDNLVKVLDFGIAKPTGSASRNGESVKNAETDGSTVTLWDDSDIAERNTTVGAIIGTASYMSPEQACGKAVDGRSDIFSFGIVLYEMLTGIRPFAGETPADIIHAIMHKKPIQQNQWLPPEIGQILDQSLAKDRDERYQTIQEVLVDLRELRRRLDYEESGRGVSVERSSGGPDGREIKPLELPSSTTSSAEYVFSEVRKHKFVSLGVLAIVIGLLATIIYSSFIVPALRTRPIDSLAVLPFINEGDAPENEYLSDGLSDGLINKLSQLPQLKVVARSSSFKYKGGEVNPQEIARALGVRAILTGRVARRGDDLQISVELIDAEDKTQIWGESYHRKVAAAQAVPEEIARTVSQKLRVRLSGEQEQQIATQITENPQAYQLYLNGVFYRRKNGTDNLKKAIEYQGQAVMLDPNFALAHTELAIDYTNLVAIGAIAPQEGMPKARSAVEKALSIDERLAEAHICIATLKWHEFDWKGAEIEIQRAIVLNPNLAGAPSAYAGYLSELGRTDEALIQNRRAQELDPLRTGLVGNEGIILFDGRRYDEALRIFERPDPDAANTPFPHIVLARTYIAKERYIDAISALQTSIRIEETPSSLIYLGRAYALSGNRREANRMLKKLKTYPKYVSPAELAILYAALGDTEKAFASLEQAYAGRDFQLTALKIEPGYDVLRGDPRFDNLMGRVGFPQ